MEHDLKTMIQNKVTNSLKNISEKDSVAKSRIKLFNFDEIQLSKAGQFYVFRHAVYNNKDIDFLNEESDSDFMIFENNGVYINYSENLFNFHKLEEEEKLIKVDLENQEIHSTSLEGDLEKMDIAEEDLSEEINKQNDLITINYFPLSRTHSYLTICVDQNFPQLLSDEFIIQALQTFSLTDNSSLKLGYNSLGAGCIINHLHFEMLFLDDFKEMEKLPIEFSTAKPFFTTRLVNKNQDDISMFDDNIQVTISTLNYPVLSWKVEANQINPSNEVGSDSSYQSSLSNCVYFILTDLIANEIPHNLVICDGGHSAYIIPRNFAQNSNSINLCWNDVAGLVTFKDISDTDCENDEKVIIESFANASMTQEKFNSISEKILEMFSSLYVVETN